MRPAPSTRVRASTRATRRSPPALGEAPAATPLLKCRAAHGDDPVSGSFSKISRRTLNDEVYLQLRGQLMAGALPPGATLTIRNLASSFGISPMPVREALRRLVAEHALVMLPNRSVAVPALSAGGFREITKIRIALEGLAAEEGTERISDADVARMRQFNALMLGPRSGPTSAYLQHNREFHFALYRASGLPTLITLIESMWLQIGPVLTFVLDHAGYRTTAVKEHHGQVLEGLARRDRKKVRAAIAEDIADAAGIVAKHL